MSTKDAPEEPPEETAAVDESDQESEDGTSDESSEGEQIEPLFAGRERRKNQGSRLRDLIEQQQDEEDDEIAALFQEEGEDEEFEGTSEEGEAAGGDEDSSDTDDEDRGPAAAADDLEGEKQLEKEEKAAKRAQKRKADQAISKPAPIRKRVKIDESASTPELEERKRKKSERISWVQTDTPVRTSSRALAVQNKERTTASLKESAARREQAIALQQAARKRKDATKAKPKTQAEKLEEAARTERINSKSLNKWQEMEEERVRKQKARLEAMHNRKIEGPFIRWCSSKAEWTDDKLTQVGKTKIVVVEPPAPKPPSKKPLLPLETATPTETMSNADTDTTMLDAKTHQSPVQGPPQDGFATLMEEMEQYAKKDESPAAETSTPAPAPAPDAYQETAVQPEPNKIEPDAVVPAVTTGVDGASDAETINTAAAPDPLALTQQPTPLLPPEPSPAVPIAPPMITHSTRTTLILHNFSPTAITHPSIQRHILLHTPLPSTLPTTTTKPGKTSRSRAAETQAPPKPVQQLCAITGLPARYRDPLTGLAYRDREAFGRIRNLVRGGCVWSDLLGAWVGRKGDGARGVPDVFWGRKGKEEQGEADGEGVKVEL